MSKVAKPLMVCIECRENTSDYKLVERAENGEWRLVVICKTCRPDA